jgi:hypothetical protein
MTSQFPPPYITSIVPDSVPNQAGDTQISINGEGFLGISQTVVLFDGHDSTIFVDSTQLDVILVAGLLKLFQPLRQIFTGF